MEIIVPHPKCPYCHDTVIPGSGPQIGCVACHAWQHQECFEAHQKCAACGISFPSPKPLAPKLPSKMSRERPWTGRRQTPYQIITELQRRITSFPEYSQVWEIVAGNCTGEIRLTGGRVYRTILEIIHGVSFGADKCDWDWITPNFSKLCIPAGYSATTTSFDSYYGNRDSSIPTIAVLETEGLRRFSPKDISTTSVSKPAERSLAQHVDIVLVGQMNGIPRTWGGWGPRQTVTVDDYYKFVPFNYQLATWNPFTYELKNPEVIKRPLLGTILTNDKGENEYLFFPVDVNNEMALLAAAKNAGLTRQDYFDQKTGWLQKIKLEVPRAKD